MDFEVTISGTTVGQFERQLFHFQPQNNGMKRVFWALGGLDINVSCCSDGKKNGHWQSQEV